MKLLLIEDDQEAADYLKRALEEAGHAVDHAEDGREGLLSAAASPYDVIILDRMLPEMDGLSILRTLRAARGAAVGAWRGRRARPDRQRRRA
ncbi:MAG: response regulator [Caulobacteraceae bacterium]